MKVLIASDKFKGTFSSKEIGEMIDKALKENDSTIETEVMQVSDGGDGLIEAIRWRNNYSRWKFLSYAANTNRKAQSKYLYNIYNSTAIVESAVTIGMATLRKDERDIMKLNSYGLGFDIARVLEVRTPKRLVIGVGGTATNDMFLGAAKALGFKFLDKSGAEVDPIPANFLQIDKIIKPDFPKLFGLEICIATDVTNPLSGENGASAVYGPQKGATPEQVEFLDGALRHIAGIIKRDFSVDVLDIPGAGAGGGIAGGIIGLIGGKIIPGADFVLDTIEFDKFASESDLIITGEGSFDNQSLQGKITGNIIKRCEKLGKKVVVVCGKSDVSSENVFPLFGETVVELDEAKKMTGEKMQKVVNKIYWKIVG